MMQRASAIALLVALLTVGVLSSASGASDAPSRCSRAAAKAVIHEHPGLHPFGPLYEAPGPVLCGPFLGGGSNAMIVSFKAATCGGTFGWGAFRRHAGNWNLVWHYRNGQRGLAKVGTGIRETLNILKPTDPRCVPTGGTKSRTWHWNGAKFVAGPWDYHYLNPEEFRSPDRKVWCRISEDYAAFNFCVVGGQPNSKEQHAAYLDSDGGVTLCSVPAPTSIESPVCIQNWGFTAPILEYGQQSEVGDIHCRSATDGITCVKLAGPGKGNGFRVNGEEAVVVD